MWILWIVGIAGIILLVNGIGQQNKSEYSKAGDGPLEVLKKRYARGEINKEEFEYKKKDLLS